MTQGNRSIAGLIQQSIDAQITKRPTSMFPVPVADACKLLCPLGKTRNKDAEELHTEHREV